MIEATTFHFYDALNAMNKSYSGMSYSGYNVFGDEKSIKWVKYLMHCEYRMKCLETEVKILREDS